MAQVPTSSGNPFHRPPKKPKKPKTPSSLGTSVEQAFQQYLEYLRNFNTGSNPWRDMNRVFPGGQLGPTYSAAQLRQQAQQALKQMFDPRIQQIQNTFKRQMELGGKNITGYTGTFVNRLGQIPIAINNANQQGLQQQAAVGGALADYMRNEGAEISADLQNRLADANLSQGQIEGTVGNAAQTGFLGSGEVAGLNAASLGRMVEEGNAWLNWGNALPGIGVLQGQQELGKFQGQMNESFAQQMGDLQSQMGEWGVSLYQNMLDRDLQRRGLGLDRQIAMGNFYGNARQQQLNSTLGGAGLLQNWAQMLLERELGLKELAQARYDTNAQIYDTDVDAATAAQAAAPDPADYPGDYKTKEDLRGGMHEAAVSYFTSTNLKTLTPNLSNARKRVMSFLRGQNSGPFALNQNEMQRLRDQILMALGYNLGGKRSPQSAPLDPGGDQPGETDGGGDFPWYPGPLIPSFPWG